MKYSITCVWVWMMTLVARGQNEDLPFCVIPKDSIVKHKITMLASEDKTYKWGLYKRKYSYNIIYTFDSSGNIISQEWISSKTKKRDHLNTYTYDEHGNLTGLEMDGKNFHQKYLYSYRYNELGLIDQYYIEPRQKLLFRYDENGKLKTKLKVSPTDTSEWWNYEYVGNRLEKEVHYKRGIQQPFITIYVYSGKQPKREVHTIGTDEHFVVCYFYDEWGHKSEEHRKEPSKTQTKRWIYKGNLLIAYYSDSEVSTYKYNGDGVLIQIKHKDAFGSVTKSKLFYKYR